MSESPVQRMHDGIKGDLDRLPLEGACQYYLNYLNNFQMDLPVALAFVNRALAEGPRLPAGAPRSLVEQAIKTCCHLAPFDPGVLRLGVESGLLPGLDTVRAVVEATNAEPDVYAQLQGASLKHHGPELRRLAREMLRRHPKHLLFAEMLLHLDLHDGLRPDEGLAQFKCPKVVLPLWRKRLFNHFATLGADPEALALWEEVAPLANDPFTLSRAAEMFRRQGDLPRCLELLEQALRLDPLQRPYALRLAELRSPSPVDHALVESRRVCILLYSYNKADILRETLESLAASDIGAAPVKILLNGCTDHSREALADIQARFPRNPVEIIELPVNIGAPAARNWLLALPEARAAEYVAFLDDDVFVPRDWLAQFLASAEADPRVGNVGCKVVFPGEFPLLQYLHRNISLADQHVVRVSLPVPHLQYDIGLYDVVRETRVVMGCLHLLRVAALQDAPWFDIRYSPSQIDDTDHDLQLCLAGWKVVYRGTVTCVHRQGAGSGAKSRLNLASQGNIMGNDLKFNYKWLEHGERLRALDSLSLNRDATGGEPA